MIHSLSFLFYAGIWLASTGSRVVLSEERVITRESTADTFNFLLHGDWGWNSYNQSLTAYEMGVYAWIVDAQFVIALGDNFYGDGVTGVNDALWDTAFHDVYTAPTLHIPWYGVLGNHDYHGSIEAQVKRTYVEDMWKMPSIYYVKHYEVGNNAILTIVYIDTCLLDPYQPDTSNIFDNEKWELNRNAHLEWLDKTLEEFVRKSQWVVVAGHYPIYSIGEHGDDTALMDDVMPILLKHQVHAYFNGHDHIHQHIYKDGIHHITAGNSAGRGPFGDHAVQYQGISHASNQMEYVLVHCGFAIAEVSDTEFYVTFIDNDGKQRYSTSLGSPKNVNQLHNNDTFGMSSITLGTLLVVFSTLFAIFFLGAMVYSSWGMISKVILSQIIRGELSESTSKSRSSYDGDIETSSDRLKPSYHGY